MAVVFATLLFWLSSALAAEPAQSVGGRLDDSIVLDVTPDGLAQLEPAVSALVPTPVEPPDFSTTVLGVVDVSVTNLSIDVQVDNVSVVPRNGRIDLDVDATVSVNTQNDPARATLVGLGCNFYLTPFSVTGSTTASLVLVPDPLGVDFDRDGVPDTQQLDVQFGEITVNDTATGNNVETPGCALGTINTLLSVFGINAFDAIINAVRPQLLAIVADLPAQIEPLLEEPFRSFAIAEEINLLGVPLYIALWPEALGVDSDGIRVGLASFVDVPRSPCIDRYGIDDFQASPEPIPDPPYPDSPFGKPHVVGFADDDFANQVGWAAWSGGLLCLDLSDPNNAFELPLDLDSTLLDLLAPVGTYDGVFEPGSPLSVVTDPKSPPVVDLTGPDDVTVLLDPIGLVIEGEVAGRRARILDLEVTARLGANLDFDGQTGEIGLGLSPIDGPDTVDVFVLHNDFAPEVDPEIEADVEELLTSVAGPLLDDVLATASPTVALPAFDGFGLESLETAASADDGSILGAYALVGTVPYSGASCTGGGGGCGQGCTSSGLPTGTTLGWLVALGLVVSRRRR